MRTKAAIEIYSYWHSLRHRRDVPLRSQVDPTRIPAILPDLFILERTLADDLRFRLAGTRVCALFARELRGMAFDALWLSGQIGEVDGIANGVLSQKTPAVLSAAAQAGRAERLPVEVVLLPLASAEGKVDRIIGSLSPSARPLWLDVAPVNFLDFEGARALGVKDLEEALKARAEVPVSVGAGRRHDDGIGGALRRVLHLRVFEGGRHT